MNTAHSLIPISSLPPMNVGSGVCRILLGSFFLGSVVGTGLFLTARLGGVSIVPMVFSGAADLLWLFWVNSWTDLVVVFLGSSIVGFLLLPLVFVCRGLLVTSLFSVFLYNGFSPFLAGMAVGLPAFFSLTALFFIAEEAFVSSLSLYRLGRGASVRFRFISSERLIVSAALLFLSAAAWQFLLPLLR